MLMKKHLKVISLLLCLVLCASVALSACLILHNAGHDCIGENCRICHETARQLEILKTIFLCCLCGGVFLVVSKLTAFVLLFVGKTGRNLNLVADKVKLTA